jgi:hypothetical protein
MAGIYEVDVPLKIAEIGDVIFQAESEKVPLSRLLRRGKKPKQMLCEWGCQKYPNRKRGGTLDGTDIATFNKTTREKLEAYAMWMMTEGWLVTKLAQLIESAGVKDEKAKQASDDGLILSRMIEAQLSSDDETAAESGETPYCSRGVFKWLSPTVQAVKPVPANFRPAAACQYSGALASFGASNMETMLNACATARKGPVDLTGYVGIQLKAQMSTWGQRDPDAEADEAAATLLYNLDAKEKKLIHTLNMFEFDAGTVNVFPSWYLLTDKDTGEASAYSAKSGIFIDLDMWELDFMQNPTAWVEPPKSGGPRGYHDAVYILKCLNPLGQCSVLSNS